MDQQIMITVGREFGSGGHDIGVKLAEHYGLPMYDKNLLYKAMDAKKITDIEDAEKFDEVPKSFFGSRTVRGLSNSPEENIARLQFDYMNEMAEKGESFVVIGRCAEEVLHGRKGLISIFVLGDYEDRREEIKERFHLADSEVDAFVKYHTKRRKGYHNYFCATNWGDSRNYDICVNSSRLGKEGTYEMLVEYIDRRIAEMSAEK